MAPVVTTPRSRVADGPINGTGWYILTNATIPCELLAPGGVVLCHDSTLTPHAGAQSAAQSAWALLRRYQAANATTALSEPHSGHHA